MDEFDQFPDAPMQSGAVPNQQDEFADFPDADAQVSQAQQPPQMEQPQIQQAPAQENTWGNAAKNVVQGLAHLGTSVTGGIVGDVAGLGALGYDILGTAAANVFDKPREPGTFADSNKVRERVAGALTYQPENPNSATNRVLTAPGQVIGGAGEYLKQKGDETGLPYLGAVLGGVPLAVASGMGVKAGAPLRSRQGVAIPSNAPRIAPEATPEQVAVRNATDLNLKLPPSAVGNTLGNAAEGATGRAPLLRELSVKNAAAIDSAAGKAVGIVDKAVTKATIGMEKIKANKAYEAVAKTGKRNTSDAYRQEIDGIGDRTGAGSFADDATPAVENLKKIYGNKKAFDAGDAVARIRKLRADSRANFKTRDPEKMAVGHAQQKIADALDNELARHVDDLGVPELAANYKAARVRLAKLNTVEQALSGAHVSAKKIHQQWKRGAPLDGELLAIAKAYDAFPQILQDAGKVAGNHPFSVVDALVAAGGAAVSPPLLAAVAARPVTRAALASDFYQRRFVRPRGRPETAKPVTAKPVTGAATTAVAPQQRKRG